jgi:hypothetical protein
MNVEGRGAGQVGVVLGERAWPDRARPCGLGEGGLLELEQVVGGAH